MLDFRDAVFEAVYDLMARDPEVVILYSDMGAQGLDKISQDFPERTINAGISEQNMISLAAGLALAGKKVFAYGIIAFVTARCFEQIRVDICSMQLPVTILGIGSGLSYGIDGPTHHAIQDIALMRALPGISIYNPTDATATKACVKIAYENKTPGYIRLDKDQHQAIYSSDIDFSQGLSVLRSGKDVCLVSTGMLTHLALKIATDLEKQGINIGLIDLYQLKPVLSNLLLEEITQYSAVVTIEEHIFYGGIGSQVAELIQRQGLQTKMRNLCLKEDQYLGSTSRKWAHENNGLSESAIQATLAEFLVK